jgi:hypothetical protein
MGSIRASAVQRYIGGCGKRLADGWLHFPTTTEGAPYLAFFWRDVGSSRCWRKGAGCARQFPVREQLAFVFFGGSTCAPFRKERRMYLINATTLHRKSEVAKPRDLQFLSRDLRTEKMGSFPQPLLGIHDDAPLPLYGYVFVRHLAPCRR